MYKWHPPYMDNVCSYTKLAFCHKNVIKIQ